MGQQDRPAGDVHLVFRDKSHAVIEFVGDFDIAGEARAEAVLRSALDAHVANLELDFTHAGFVGVSAVRFVLGAQERVRTYGGRVRVNASDAARRVFDLTHARVVFDDA